MYIPRSINPTAVDRNAELQALITKSSSATLPRSEAKICKKVLHCMNTMKDPVLLMILIKLLIYKNSLNSIALTPLSQQFVWHCAYVFITCLFSVYLAVLTDFATFS